MPMKTMYPWCYITQLTPDSLTEYAFTDHMTAQNGYITGPRGSYYIIQTGMPWTGNMGQYPQAQDHLFYYRNRK